MAENLHDPTELDAPMTSFIERCHYATGLPLQALKGLKSSIQYQLDNWNEPFSQGNSHFWLFRMYLQLSDSFLVWLLWVSKSHTHPRGRCVPWLRRQSWRRRHICSHIAIAPVIRIKETYHGYCCNNDAWLHLRISSLEWCVWPDCSVCEHVWRPLGNGTVKHAEIMALTINTADVPYFRWTNNSQLTALVSAPYLSD